MKSYLAQHRIATLALVLFALSVLLGLFIRPVVTSAAPPDPVTAAWERARATGSYRFSSDITQVTLPLATLTNVGRASHTEKLHLEGQNALHINRLEMTLWSEGGSVLQAESGVAIRTEDGKTFARRGAGAWEAIDDFTGSIAPQGDFMSYLAAIKQVQAQPAEEQGGIKFVRYTFQIDSPKFAVYLHKQMEAVLRARGELPPGIQLDVPAYFRDMVGAGELWVGNDGLPLRQILTLQFPAQVDEQIQTQIVVDFSQYGSDKSVISDQWRHQWNHQWSAVKRWLGMDHWVLTTDHFIPSIFFLGLFAFAVLLLYYRRVRLVQITVVVLVIFAQVIGPLLTTYTSVKFFDAQTAKAAVQKERQAAADEDRELREALGTVAFNPHLNPLASEEQRRAAADSSLESTLPSPVANLQAAPVALLIDNGVDTDGDTLTDFAEERIGTSMVISDTDSDGLRDNIEVKGFDFGGQTWYTNPEVTDSNGDGQGDLLEWGLNTDGNLRASPLDSDGDSFPDLFDPDNDGDGVPDNKDLAPQTKGAAIYSEASPLHLTLNHLTAGKPTFVEFQLRPQDEQQLWFAFNVLDWPQDSEGQIRDVDGKTYADMAVGAGRTADANERNGDMKVIPMLEIRMPANSANLPAQAELTPFNITLNDFTPDGQTQVAYVPLNIVTDEKTGQRVAFSGQMRYLPTGAWDNPHQVRLAWVVQALVDLPCDKTLDTSADCQADGVRNNMPQVLQSYYSDWTLTGLNVREEHGTDMAIFYEDPTVDANKKDDAAVWALAHVFDQHFVIGRDLNNDGVRDLKIVDFAARFDRDNNPSAAQRMDVPNILQVETRSYPTLDAAIASTTMTETATILNNVFKPQVESDRAIKPLLFFAQENRSRLLGLDLRTAGAGYVTESGSALTFDLAPSPETALTVDINVGMKWMGYCDPASGAVTLTPCSDDEYWTTLEARYAALAPLPSDDNTEDWVGGRVMLTQLFFTGLRSGFYANVQSGPQILSFKYRLESESETATAVRATLQGLSTVPLVGAQSFYRLFPGYVPGDAPWIQKKATIGYAKILREGLKDAQETLIDKQQNRDQQDPVKGLAKAKAKVASARYLIFRFAAAVAGVAGTMLMVSLQIASLFPNLPHNTRAILGGFAIALNAAINIVAPIVDVVRSLISSPLSAAKVLTFVGKSYAVVARGAAVGAVLSVVLIWGFFIYGAVANGLAPGTPQFNRAAAEAIAATIIAVLLAVLAANPIGAIIAAILGVIDGILTLICELGVEELRKVNTLDGACFTLTTALTKALTKLIYSYDLMVNLERNDLMVTGAPQVILADASKGYVGGNTVSVVLPVTTTIVHKDPDLNNGVLIGAYLYLFSADNLRYSSFQYSLSRNDQTPLAQLGEMSGRWQNVRADRFYQNQSMYRAEMSTLPPALGNLPLSVGINTTVPFILNMSYAIPAYECWLVFVVPVCYLREFKSDNHLPINSLQYDVLPPTLEGFLALTGKGDGGLGQAWDARFSSLRDADGDSLLSTTYNGLDPNDASADADGDGLTDRYELDRQTTGTLLSPILRDTDNDGLPDAQELRLGSDPGVADSDNDGLTDGEEVRHLKIDPDTGLLTTNWAGGWAVGINAATPFTVFVTSDPLNADGDNDGLPDQTERQLAQDANPANRVDNQNRPYHPGVPNSPPLALLVEIDDVDGFLAPAQSLRYTNTVLANTAVVPGVLNVNAPIILGNGVNPLALGFNPLTFTSTQTVTQGISLTVAPGIGTQQMRLNSTATTRLKDTGPAAWGFAPITTEAPLGGIGAPALPYFTAATASRPDRQDNFLLSTLAIESLGAVGFGDILAYSIPGGGMRAIENDASNTAAILGNHPHRLATNTAGDTLAVWDQQRYCNDITLNSLKVVTAGADTDATAGIEPVIGFQPDSSSESEVWRWDQNGGTSMTSGQQRGPNAFGFPLTLTYCGGPLTLNVYDNDAATKELVGSKLIDLYEPLNGPFTFTGAGHSIEINLTVPLRDAKVIAGALVGSDGQIKRSITFPTPPVPTTYQRQSYGPVVASDGSGFLVAYETFAENTKNGSYGLPQVVVQAFDRDGNLLSSVYRDAGSTQAGALGAADLALATAWIGNGYRVIWQDRRASAIYSANATNNGQTLTQPQLVTQSGIVNGGVTEAPGISYDPVSGRTFILYLASTREILGRVYAGDTLVAGPKVVSLAQFPAARSPQVVWHPNYRGWLLSYQDNTASQRHVFIPLDTNGDPAFAATSGFFIAANDNTLACPAPQSAALVDLRFEELPGATSFVDASGRANNGICTGAACPTAGISGAPNAPTSDYAARFDGVDDELTINRTIQDDFSVVFWLKAPTLNGQRMLVDGGDFNTTGFHILLNNGGVLVRTPGTGFQTTRIDDDQWHFVAVSRNKATGRVDIYVDGNAIVGLNGSPDVTLNGVADLRIGKRRNNTQPLLATLDQFQIFPAALAQDTVLAMYNRTLQSYCVAAGPRDSNVYWAKVQASQPDVRGGRLSASNGLTLTIDNDLPTAQITAVQNNEIVGPGQVIGGTAADATAGIGRIEVSINDGAWQLAEGANSWAFSLAGQNGAISLRVRATDNVGNVGNPSASLNLTVDSIAPVVALNAPAETVKPTKNASSQWQVNLTGTANDASGIKPETLLVRVEQQSGVGVAQTEQQATLNGTNWHIDYTLDASLYDPTGFYTVTVNAVDAVGNAATPVTSLLRLDASGPNAALSNTDATRTVISQTLTIGGIVSDTNSIAGIDKVEIAFTPVEQIAALSAGLTGEQAEAQLNRVWTPVTLTQRGAGVGTTTWSYQLPTGLENLYQLDLRGTDMLGNVAVRPNLWRGDIDTTDPRLVMTATDTGVSYFDAASNQRHYAIRFVCAAVDRNLNEASFACPGKGVAEPIRSFASIPALQALFPDLTIRSGLAISYTLWTPTVNPSATVRACDSLGRCAQATSTSSVAIEAPVAEPVEATAVEPQAVIVAPTDGSFVAANEVVSVTVAAEAGAALKEVTISLDGVIVQTLSFAQDELVTTTQRTVGIAIANEGEHTLVAQATNWAGATQSTLFPVTFTLDKAAPSVTIDTSTLTIADTWQAQSGILRFNGTADDSVGLAAVQIREGDNNFVDANFASANFASGEWHTALPVQDPEGRTLTITVRAIDRAGRISAVTQPIATDLSAADAPDTTLLSGPANPNHDNTANFTFAGGASAVTFDCQLDAGAYQPCTSPTSYRDLSKGGHTFRVRAIDSRGFPDLSPAEFAWTISASAVDATITSGPSNPTTERSASFTFTGSGATGFECRLDAAAFAACSSPQNYSGLNRGAHSFQVRGRNGDTVGAADRYLWTISNTAPTATDQTLTTPQATAIAITLLANDEDPITYKLIDLPAHGVLLGTPPTLTYTPDSGFLGTDQFTFVANDGLADSNVAVISITVTAKPAGSSTRLYLPIIHR